MRHSFLPFLVNLPLFFAPFVVLGSAQLIAVEPQPAANGGDAGQQPDSDQAQSGDSSASEMPKKSKTAARPTSMDIIADSSGMKMLNIHFRWKLFPDASVEVRLVSEPIPQGATVTPIYFSEHLKGPIRDALYTCLDHTGEGGHTHSFTKDKIVYDMIGRRNSLGRQGVHVKVHREGKEADTAQDSPPKAPPAGAHVHALPQLNAPEDWKAYPASAYLQLDTWAVDQETLSLEMARDEFAKPGMLYVWFFRGDQVVWDEQIRWPGYK